MKEERQFLFILKTPLRTLSGWRVSGSEEGKKENIMQLVINANAALCRIYHYTKSPFKLTLLKEIIHPENRLKDSDIYSDRNGHYQAGEHSRGAYSPHMDAKAVLLDNFAREITHEINHERMKNGLDGIVIISPPHMDGLLYQHLDKHVKNMVVHNIKKDLLHMKDDALLSFLQLHTRYPGEN